MTAFESASNAFTRRETRSNLDVLGVALDDVDDDVLACLRHVWLGERNGDAREDAQGRDSLLCRSYVARAVRSFDFERDSSTHDPLVRVIEPVKNDVTDDDLVALGD